MEAQAAERAQVQATLRAHQLDSGWPERIASLAAFARQRVAGQPLPAPPVAPPEFPAPLARAWELLARTLQGERSAEEQGPEFSFLAEQLGIALAAAPGSGPEEWFRACEILKPCQGAGLAFLDTLDLELVRAHEAALLTLPTKEKLLQSLDTFGPLREPEQQRLYLEELDSRERAAEDLWSWLEEVDRYADSIRFRGSLWARAYLFERLGGIHWLRFLRALPIDLLRVIAAGEIDSLDEVGLEVGLLLKEAAVDEPTRKKLLTVLLRRGFELFSRLHAGLTHAARGLGFEPPESRTEAVAVLAEWKERELPGRAQYLASQLLQPSTPSGFEVAALALRHLFARSPDLSRPSAESETVPVIRKALLEGLQASGRALGEIIRGILGTRATKSALLATSLAVLEPKNAVTPAEQSGLAVLLWSAYIQQLQEDKYFWYAPLAEDEFLLAWLLAGVLALLPQPEGALQTGLDSVHLPSEGWKADYVSFLETLSNVSHLLIVGAMASEWMAKQGRAGHRALFRHVWSFLHSWLRTVPEHVAADKLQGALVQVWARLPLMEGPASTERALAEFPRLDRVEWLLGAAVHLQANQPQGEGPSRLDLKLQQILWERFEAMFPLFRSTSHVTAELATRYQNEALRLTPDISHASPDA